MKDTGRLTSRAGPISTIQHETWLAASQFSGQKEVLGGFQSQEDLLREKRDSAVGAGKATGGKLQPPAGVLGCPRSWLFLTPAAFLPACYCVCEAPAQCTWESPTTVENSFILPHLCPFSPGLGAWRGGSSRRVLTGLENKIQLSSSYGLYPTIPAVGSTRGTDSKGLRRSSAEGNTPRPWTAESWEISTPFLVLDEQVNQTFILVTKKPSPFKKHTDPVLLVCVALSQYP